MALSKIDVANMLTGEVPNANVATVGVAKGGTGLTSGTSGQFLKFTGSTTLASSADNAGKILQVQSLTLATEAATTSSSFADTSLTKAITPSSTSNKVLITVNHGMHYTSSGTEGQFKINRTTGDTSLTTYVINLDAVASSGGGGVQYLDSPSSTSAITYTVQMKRSNGGGSVVLCANNSSASITLEEISA